MSVITYLLAGAMKRKLSNTDVPVTDLLSTPRGVLTNWRPVLCYKISVDASTELVYLYVHRVQIDFKITEGGRVGATPHARIQTMAQSRK